MKCASGGLCKEYGSGNRVFSFILFRFSERCNDEMSDVDMDTSYCTEHRLLIPDSAEMRGVNNNMSSEVKSKDEVTGRLSSSIL